MDESIMEFIESHTHSGKEGRFHYGTKRDSSKTAFAWKTQMHPDDVDTMQVHCYESIIKLGYKMLPLNPSEDRKSLLLPLTLNSV